MQETALKLNTINFIHLLRFHARGFTAPDSSRLVDSRWLTRFLRPRVPRVLCLHHWLVPFPRHHRGSPTTLAPCRGAPRFPESVCPARRVPAPSWNGETSNQTRTWTHTGSLRHVWVCRTTQMVPCSTTTPFTGKSLASTATTRWARKLRPLRLTGSTRSGWSTCTRDRARMWWWRGRRPCGGPPGRRATGHWRWQRGPGGTWRLPCTRICTEKDRSRGSYHQHILRGEAWFTFHYIRTLWEETVVLCKHALFAVNNDRHSFGSLWVWKWSMWTHTSAAACHSDVHSDRRWGSLMWMWKSWNESWHFLHLRQTKPLWWKKIQLCHLIGHLR